MLWILYHLKSLNQDWLSTLAQPQAMGYGRNQRVKFSSLAYAEVSLDDHNGALLIIMHKIHLQKPRLEVTSPSNGLFPSNPDIMAMGTSKRTSTEKIFTAGEKTERDKSHNAAAIEIKSTSKDPSPVIRLLDD